MDLTERRGRHSLRRAIFIVTALSGVYSFSMMPCVRPAFAQRENRVVTLQAGSGSVLPIEGAAENIFAVDPKVAEVRPAGQGSMFVFGLAPGQTTVTAVDASGNTVAHYVIQVIPSAYPAAQIARATGAAARGLQVSSDDHGVSISGNVDTADAANDTLSAAADKLNKGDKLRDRLSVRGSIQVNLRVRVVEMSRELVRELGVQWESVNALGTSAAIGVATQNPLAAMTSSASSFSFLSRFKIGGKQTTLETVIDALSSDQLVHSLAEPNLTTVSGQPANFIVGGEYPVPISSYNNNISVSYKQYGISLSFIPTVISSGRISLHVIPEVSALTNQGAVTLPSSSSSSSSVTIPALTVRRVDTTVELGSGQSFAIAGLLQDNTTTNGLGLPFLGDIPVLGALFRSDSFQRDQSELVVIVTPYIVRPVDNEAALHAPDDQWRPPNDLERILELRQVGRPPLARSTGVAPHIAGNAGFMVE